MPEAIVECILPDGRLLATEVGAGAVRLRGEALPGEHVLWEPAPGSGKRREGDVRDVLRRSPQRRSVTCEWSSECGGCDMEAWSISSRSEAIQATVGQLLQLEEAPTWHAPSSENGYRARVSLRIVDGRLGYTRARSHELVEIERCEIANDGCNAGMQALREWLTANPESHPYVDGAELRTNGHEIVYSLRTRGKSPPHVWRNLKELGNVALDGKRRAGHTTLEMPGGIRASAGAFYQVNLETNAALVAHAVGQLSGATAVLELYCGNGNFTVPLAKAGKRVTAVEFEGASLADLRLASREQGLDIEVVGKNVLRLDPTQYAYDGVLLDPPRAGAPGVLEKVLRQRPLRVVYISCNPTSLVRDLRTVKGYRLDSVHCFDMFPKTHHVETVVTLERSHPRDSILPMR